MNWTEDDHMTPEQERACDEARRLHRDAARWRISQITYPRSMDDPLGYFVIRDDDGSCKVGIQPHPVTSARSIGGCILGRGRTEGEAMDDLFLTLTALVEGGAVLPDEIEAARQLFLTH